MMIFLIISLATVSYLVGNINFSIKISKWVDGRDIRNLGSGNAGTTNMQRNYGTKWSVLVLCIDVVKASVAVIVGQLIFAYFATADFTPPPFAHIAGLFVIVGHIFPVFYQFRGGKGVASALGVALILNWQLALIATVAFVVIVATSRYVSLGAILALILFVIGEALLVEQFSIGAAICTCAFGAIVILKHGNNIRQLLNGTERKLNFKR
jgi:glycerol-3-phosphate acyltransferase PlsY